MSRQLDKYKSKYPNNEVVFISNSKKELKKIREFGLNARFVNKNSFQREDQFTVQKNVEKVYDAAMNARMARWKRIELAQNVNQLAMITVIDEEEYYSEMREVLPDDTEWVNFDESGNYVRLPQTEVCRVLNQSRTGLILSALEANNKASIEYLLCGLPVVSTPSEGGRDVFFDEDYCAIVEPTPEAVRQGVSSMATRNIDPKYIRQQTLEKIRDHRARFLSLVSDLTDGSFSVSVDEWLDRFPRNMSFRCQPNHFRLFLESEYLTERPEFTAESIMRERRPDLWHSITNGKAEVGD